MFNQVLNPFGSVFAVWLVALAPVAVLLFLLVALIAFIFIKGFGAAATPGNV